MTVVAGFVLGGYTLNAVGGVQFPGGKRIEIAQAVHHVRSKQAWIRRWVSQDHILKRSLVCLVGVETNLEEHFGFTTLVIEKPLFVGTNVATEAVLVGLRVADLAGNRVFVDSM